MNDCQRDDGWKRTYNYEKHYTCDVVSRLDETTNECYTYSTDSIMHMWEYVRWSEDDSGPGQEACCTLNPEAQEFTPQRSQVTRLNAFAKEFVPSVLKTQCNDENVMCGDNNLLAGQCGGSAGEGVIDVGGGNCNVKNYSSECNVGGVSDIRGRMDPQFVSDQLLWSHRVDVRSHQTVVKCTIKNYEQSNCQFNDIVHKFLNMSNVDLQQNSVRW